MRHPSRVAKQSGGSPHPQCKHCPAHAATHRTFRRTPTWWGLRRSCTHRCGRRWRTPTGMVRKWGRPHRCQHRRLKRGAGATHWKREHAWCVSWRAGAIRPLSAQRPAQGQQWAGVGSQAGAGGLRRARPGAWALAGSGVFKPQVPTQPPRNSRRAHKARNHPSASAWQGEMGVHSPQVPKPSFVVPLGHTAGETKGEWRRCVGAAKPESMAGRGKQSTAVTTQHKSAYHPITSATHRTVRLTVP
jgi:hypothetical protein